MFSFHSLNQTDIKMSTMNVAYLVNYFKYLSHLKSIDSWSDLFYRLLFDHENLNSINLTNFFAKNYKICFYYVVVYLLFLIVAQRWMAKRDAYSLRFPLAIWNGMLAIFSASGMMVVWPEFMKVLTSRGFVATYTDSVYHLNNSCVLWYTLFTLSKVPELIDTVFIVLRKQRLLPLHWIHHVLTLIFCFFVFSDGVAQARWMVCMNLSIHSLMYAYYCLKSLRIHIPRAISLMITMSQIVQMFIGLYIHAHILVQLTWSDQHCHSTYRSALAGLVLYLLFFYFFVQFFIDSYVIKRHKQTNKKLINNDFNNNINNRTITFINGSATKKIN